MPEYNGIPYPREHNGTIINHPSEWPGGKPPAALVRAYRPGAALEPDEDEGESGGTALVNINTATAAELCQTIKGVGEETAADIIAHRPFESVDDLERVGGIGPAKIAKHRELLTV